jgi:hypothetical protein
MKNISYPKKKERRRTIPVNNKWIFGELLALLQRIELFGALQHTYIHNGFSCGLFCLFLVPLQAVFAFQFCDVITEKW